jgi:CBS domain containing-hemolysin-like protein
MPPSGYLLVTEPDSDEIASSVSLKHLVELPRRHLEHLAEPVLYAPWCTTAESLLEDMIRRDREVAAVVNEFGETIGIVTFDDLLDSLLRIQPSRSSRLLQRSSIEPIGEGVWKVTGMTSLRRIAKHFGATPPASRSATVSGVLQESLGRLPDVGDECDWGPFHLRVLCASQRGPLDVELTMPTPPEDST